jgi:hypothetical protein
MGEFCILLHPVACIIRINMNTVYATIFYIPLFFIVLYVATYFGLTDHHLAIHKQISRTFLNIKRIHCFLVFLMLVVF